jgi:hypothetical protein
MIACLAPVDTFYEENLSTLEYARQAGRITNQVTMNEDPRTRLIRELRAEVAFLREQLAAVQGPGAAAALAAAPPTGMSPLPGRGGSTDGGKGGIGKNGVGKGGAGASKGGGVAADELLAGGAAAAAGNVDDMRAALLESTQHDIGMMVSKLVDAVTLVQSLSNINGQLRRAYDNVSKHSEELRIDNDTLMMENAQIRDRLSFIEGVAGIEEQGPGTATTPQRAGQASGGGGSTRPGGSTAGASDKVPNSPIHSSEGVYTPGTAAMLELQELRRENALLHDRLRSVGAPGSLMQSEAARSRTASPSPMRVAGGVGIASHSGQGQGSAVSRQGSVAIGAGGRGGGRGSRAGSREGLGAGGAPHSTEAFRSMLSVGIGGKSAPASPIQGGGLAAGQARSRMSGMASAASSEGAALPGIRRSSSGTVPLPGAAAKRPPPPPPLITFSMPEHGSAHSMAGVRTPSASSGSVPSSTGAEQWGSGGPDDSALRLTQLMATRSQMSRARMLDESAPVSPGPLSRRHHH